MALAHWGVQNARAAFQPPLPPQRTFVAKPLLLVSAGAVASVARPDVCGFESSTSRHAERPDRYPWSSAAAHANHRDAAGLLDLGEWSEVAPNGEWKQLLRTRALDAAESASLRAATYQGRPFGDARFLKALEARLARNLEPKPMGRPPNTRTAAAG
jgi:hypothetical protein